MIMSRLKLTDITVANDNGAICTVKLHDKGIYEIVLAQRALSSAEWDDLFLEISRLLVELDEGLK